MEEAMAEAPDQSPGDGYNDSTDSVEPVKGKTLPPEAKAVAQKLIAVAMRIVYKQDITAQLLEMIRKAPRPEIGIVQGVFLVLKQIKDNAKGVPENVIDSMAKRVAQMILELASEAKLIENKPETLKMVTTMIQKALGMARNTGNAPQPGPSSQMTPPNAGPMTPDMGPQGMIAGQMGG